MSVSIYSPLEDKVLNTQTIFRAILSAASFPGTIVSIKDETSAWGELDAAGAGIIQTLCDHSTSIYLSPSLKQSTIVESIAFHTGAQLAAAHSAAFVLATADDILDYAALDQGDEYTPERAATLILQIKAWDGGRPLTLSGPGIKQARTRSPLLPEALLKYFLAPNKPAYPCGIDILLIRGDELMSIPRTTNVKMETE